MKITAQEEYGLRILLQIARHRGLDNGLTISQISEAEGLSEHNVAKLCRLLRMEGFIISNRGQTGGYSLAKPASDIRLNDLVCALGGRLYESAFCDSHTGVVKICTHSVDCSIRSLWQVLQQTVDQVLNNLTLQDLVGAEDEFASNCVDAIDILGDNLTIIKN